jgi:hypothetical protein
MYSMWNSCVQMVTTFREAGASGLDLSAKPADVCCLV